MILLLTLSLALVNLLVGVAMALTWEWCALPAGITVPNPSVRTTTRTEKRPAPVPASDVITVEVASAVDLAVEDEIVEDMPVKWLELLSDSAYQSRGFLEATTLVLQLKVKNYREQLLCLEDRVRASLTEETSLDLTELVDEMILLNSQWLTTQGEALGALIDRRSEQGTLAEIATELEESLLEQTAQIETSRSKLEALLESPINLAQKIIGELQRLLACVHRLSNLMQQSLAGILVSEQRFEEFEQAWQQDSLCGIANQAGMEVRLHELRKTRKGQRGKNSLVLFDFDQFREVNEQYGTRMVDAMLRTTAGLIENGLSKSRGLHCLGRYGHHQLALLFGGTPPEKAALAAERLRKLLEATPLEIAGNATTLSTRAAVVELEKRESFAEAAKRWEPTLAAAESHEASCTFLDTAKGPQLVAC